MRRLVAVVLVLVGPPTFVRAEPLTPPAPAYAEVGCGSTDSSSGGGPEGTAGPVRRPGRRSNRRLGEGLRLRRPAAKKPATADTVYRVGSVSKLFTDLAVMQLVEQGALDLDAPVTKVPARLQAGQPVRQADHAAAAHVPPLRPGARAARRQLLRPDRAVAGEDRRRASTARSWSTRRGRRPSTATPASPSVGLVLEETQKQAVRRATWPQRCSTRWA